MRCGKALHCENCSSAPARSLLSAVVLLSLVLTLFPAPALAQEPVSAQPAPESPEQEDTPTQPPVDCADPTRPDSAQHILAFPEQEVGVTYKAGSNPRWTYYQYANGTLSNMVFGTPDYANAWQQSVAVDMNGDGWDETVSAYRDGNGQLAARSDIWHWRYGGLTSYSVDTWTSNADRLKGDNVKWIDIAAGNLLRHSDGRREVVVALRNDEGDLELILLNGSDDGGLAPPNGTLLAGSDFTDPTDGRENVYHVSVATGDLNADGFDDDVVTAFKDGGNHLQVLVLRRNNGAWQKLASYRYADEATSHGAYDIAHKGDFNESPSRGVAVATGDVEGDGMDEAIISFVDDNNHLQTIAMGLTPATSGDTPYKLQEEGYYWTEEDTRDPHYVSVAAPDLNGDGLAEILVAFGARNNNFYEGEAPAQVWRLSYGVWEDDPDDSDDQGTFLKRDKIWKDRTAYDAGMYTWAEVVSIAKVNVDKGAREKAILAFNEALKDTNLKTQNDHVAVRLLYEPGDAQSLALEASQDIATGADRNYDVSAIAGDVDANGSWLSYTGECKQYGVSTLNTVLNMPPVWYDYYKSYLGVGAAFGRGINGSVEHSETTEFTYGASYTIDGSASFADIFEFGPKISAEFEGSHAVNEEESMEVGTEQEYATVFGNDSTSGLVVQQTLDFHLYKYIEDDTGKEVWVRVPVLFREYNDSMELWNTRQHYRGWLPVGPRPRGNLALGKPATQSSTYYSSYASMAVDGNTDGNWWNHSVSHTNNDPGAWWQVDLGNGQAVEYPIESVNIWNRTDAVPERLANYVVKVYDKNGVLTWTSPTQAEIAGLPTVVPVGRTGRTLRIQLLGTNYLSLAEVEVWRDPRVNLALGKSAGQSSNYNNIASAGRAVDGNTNGDFFNGSVSSTESQANAWWQVDLGEVYPINEIDIWNRTDCCADRLVNYVIKLSDTDSDAAWASPKWQSSKHTVQAGHPTTDMVGKKARYVRIQFVDGYTNYLSLAEVQVWKGREASDYPKLIHRDSDYYFTITNQDGSTEKVPGNLKWDWCSGYLDEEVEALAGIYVKDLVVKQPAMSVYQGQGENTWKISSTKKKDAASWTDKWGIKGSFGYEGKFMGVGAEWSVTAGFGQEETTTQAWSDSTYFEGRAGYLEQNTRSQNYDYCPYYYMTTSTTADGVQQAYLVLDYYVPTIYPPPAAASSLDAPAMLPQARPGTPLIASSTHPDPDAWSTDTTATFTWQQPADDPVANPLYAWAFDRQPDTVPGPQVGGPNQTDSYYNLPDGTFYLHVRAMSPGGEWSDTAHRRIRIDRLAPEVALVRDPLDPGGNQGWYTVPVTVTASATDAGSGLAALETSSDGTSWQPYAGPLQFNDNTPATTIWARASDVAGHVSEPVSTTLKVDLTPPNSQSLGSCDSGGVCAGRIIEAISGIAGMEIQVDGGSWTSVSALGEWQSTPGQPPTPWAYAALLDVGHGHHIIYGRAADGAGHVEAAHKIAEVTFYPTASPDLSGSSIAIEPAVARPGEVVTVTLNVRNGGLGEAYVAISATLPVGLAPAEGALASLDNSITYDPATGVITWPDRLLWPGQAWRTQFQAVVADDVPAGTLTAQLGAHGSWPNIELLTPEEQQRFRDYEAGVTTNAVLQVDPQLPADQDVMAPHVQLTIRDTDGAAGARVDLALQADPDAWLMYLREWTLDPVSGAWTVARSSGWFPYTPSLAWTLSEGGGVKYLGAWVADVAGNVSTLDETSLALTNRLIEDNLAAGQRRQYRFLLEDGVAVFNLLTTSGLADLYAWLPGQGGSPEYVAEGSDLVKTLGFRILLEGVYLLEAAAAVDSTYTLLNAAGSAAAVESGASESPAPPDHPLTLTTPLTAGAGAAPGLDLTPIYLPIALR
jgi:hypothetical protein